MLGTGCLHCGDPTRHVCWAWCVGLCRFCFHGGTAVQIVGSIGRCLWIPEGVKVDEPATTPQHLFALRTLAIVLGCAAMASGGKGYYAAQAASSSSSGGDPAQGWNAAASLRQIAAQRAGQWREAEGLQDDNNFAYAYLDYDRVHGGLGGPPRGRQLAPNQSQGRRRPASRRCSGCGRPP